MAVRFQNLVSLLRDMENLGWKIDSFPFYYNGVNTIVVIKRYTEEDVKPSEYAKIKVIFVLKDNSTKRLKGWADFLEVKFGSVKEFCNFWHIQERGSYRELFIAFAEHFARFIPARKIEEKDDEVERRILGGYAEGNDPLAIYCYDVRRNGERDGVPNKRSWENSDKARLLRPNLYSLYSSEPNLSFFFSKNPEDEKTDEAIMSQVASR